MVADGRAFGISLGIYSAVCVGCLLFFGAFRKTRICKKFYAPKRCERSHRLACSNMFKHDSQFFQLAARRPFRHADSSSTLLAEVSS